MKLLLCALLVMVVISFKLKMPPSAFTRSTLLAKSPVDQTRRGPIRNDVCKVLVSGIIGTDPKEIYLKNGHYVVNCALAVVGHFDAIHALEQHKPAEAMWLSVEVWDGLAKAHYQELKKGSIIRGVGYIVQNMWIDKLTGEERKMYKLRISKMLTEEAFKTAHTLLEEIIWSPGETRGMNGVDNDSAFGVESPPEEDQSITIEQPLQNALNPSQLNGFVQNETDGSGENQKYVPWWE